SDCTQCRRREKLSAGSAGWRGRERANRGARDDRRPGWNYWAHRDRRWHDDRCANRGVQEPQGRHLVVHTVSAPGRSKNPDRLGPAPGRFLRAAQEDRGKTGAIVTLEALKR